MLSAAKHLQYLLKNKQMQILRSAQDDSRGDFFRSVLRLLRLAIGLAFLLFVDRLVARIADAGAAVCRNEQVRQSRGVRSVATQARHLLTRTERVCNISNGMSRPGMSETQAGIKLNFGSRFELGLRD